MKMIIGLLLVFGMVLLVGTKLVSGASWSAYVLNESGFGLNEVNVSAVLASNNNHVNSTLTDVNGFFIIGIPDSTSVNLVSSKQTYLTDTSQSLPNITADLTLPFNITLEKVSPGNLSGRITDAGGEGIENANVSALQNNLTIASVLTNSSGHYIIPNLRDGTYDLRITATSYLTQDFTNVVVLPGNTTVTDISPSLDTIPPIISNVSATLITSSETVIIWQTDESANSSVDYYVSGGSVLSSSSATLMTSHMVRLSSLSSSTLYFYNVSSCDFAGNCNTSVLYNFTTLVVATEFCGDGTCSNDETCSSCSLDCGSCGGGGCALGYKSENRKCVKIETEEKIPSQLFDIKLELEDFLIQDISELVVIVTFESFGTEPTPVSLLFTILNENGKEAYSEEHAIIVETEEVFRRRFAGVDLDLPNGKYTFILTTLYNVNVVDEFRQEFEITGKKKAISIWIWIVGGIVVVLVAISTIYLFIKLRKNKLKKRKIRSKRR